MYTKYPGRFILLVLCLIITKANAADPLYINIRQADSLFIKNNFELLASSMNIEAQKAQVIQARVYPNPVFTADVNAYNPGEDRFFQVGNTGQKFFQLEQLIILGGKRRSQIELAKTNAGIAELEFQDLLRQLKYELHTSMYALNQQKLLLDLYNSQLSLLDTILAAYDIQAVKGNIPLKDVVRIKGVYLNLNNDRAELLKMYLAELSKVQSILQTDQVVIPVIDETDFAAKIKSADLQELKNIALENRPDYQVSQQNIIAAQQYYSFQKRTAIPDINVFTSYDQRSGAFDNQINAGIAIPLPLWDRNRGNIKTSRFQIRQQEYNEQGLKNKIYAELQNNYLLYNQTISEYEKSSKLYNKDFEITLKGMSDNFKKQNVSILEFVDFFEAYNDALAEIARIKIQLAISAEQLNLTIGKDIY